jgi:hypothetical protein
MWYVSLREPLSAWSRSADFGCARAALLKLQLVKRGAKQHHLFGHAGF